MARKRKRKSDSENMKDLLSLHVPSSYLDYFDLVMVENKPDCWELVLEEKGDLVPKVLVGEEVVLDGFCNPVNVLSHSFSLKKIYLVIYRRRWKHKGDRKHYSNSYDFHAEGLRVTEELAAFLKEVDRMYAR